MYKLALLYFLKIFKIILNYKEHPYKYTHLHRPIYKKHFMDSGDQKVYKSGENSASKILTENNTSIS